jgi:hypothetical protein
LQSVAGIDQVEKFDFRMRSIYYYTDIAQNATRVSRKRVIFILGLASQADVNPSPAEALIGVAMYQNTLGRWQAHCRAFCLHCNAAHVFQYYEFR